jgi:hypothetical protein
MFEPTPPNVPRNSTFEGVCFGLCKIFHLHFELVQGNGESTLLHT